MWKTNITGSIVKEFGEEWKQHEDQAAAYYGNAGSLKKNPLAVSRALEGAWSSGLKSENLQELVNSLLSDDTSKTNNSMQPTTDAATN